MPYAGDVYSLPPGTSATSNTTILSAMFNAFVADIAAAQNAARPVAAGGTGAATAGAAFDNLHTASSNIASATTTDLSTATGYYVQITGTTTITGFGTEAAGVPRFLRFAGALTLTHNATSLILPGAANITTAAGDTAVFVSEGSGNWRCLAYQRASGEAVVSSTVGLPAGHIYGLTLSNNGSDATNDIDIAAGSARDASDTVNMVLASALTKRLDAAWAVGTNQGGLDTGAIANTTYHVWLIKRNDTGVVDVLFSTSASSPTMPSNYDYKRRIGSIIRSGGTILAFTQNGDEFLLKVPLLDVNVNTLSTTATSYTLTVPAGIQSRAFFSATGNNGSANWSLLLTSLDQTDTATTYGGLATLMGVVNNLSSTSAYIRTNTSAQIRARANAANQNVQITTMGWIDTRGRGI